jgi:hypothetical protein
MCGSPLSFEIHKKLHILIFYNYLWIKNKIGCQIYK